MRWLSFLLWLLLCLLLVLSFLLLLSMLLLQLPPVVEVQDVDQFHDRTRRPTPTKKEDILRLLVRPALPANVRIDGGSDQTSSFLPVQGRLQARDARGGVGVTIKGHYLGMKTKCDGRGYETLIPVGTP